MRRAADRAFVELFLDSAPLTRGLNAAGAKLKSFGGTALGIGAGLFAASAAVAVPLAMMVNEATEYGSAIKDASDRTGIAAEELQELRHAAEQSGASFEDLETAFQFMRKGGHGKSVEDFLRLLDEIPNSSNAAARMTEVFGRGGLKLGGMLKEGAGGVRALMEEARRLGIVMGEDDVEAAEAFGDELANLEKMTRAAKREIGSALIPTLRDLMGPLTEGVRQVKAFIAENRQIAVTVAAVAVGLAVGGAALAAFGISMIGLGATLTVVSSLIGGIGAVIGFVLTPIGAVTTAALALGAAFVYSWAKSAEGGAVLSRLGENFSAFAARTGDTIGAIKNAFSAKDFGLAAEIAFLAVKIEVAKFRLGFMADWRAFTASIKSHWETFWGDFSKGFTEGWEQILFKLNAAWETFWYSLDNPTQAQKEGFDKDLKAQWERRFPNTPFPGAGKPAPSSPKTDTHDRVPPEERAAINRIKLLEDELKLLKERARILAETEAAADAVKGFTGATAKAIMRRQLGFNPQELLAGASAGTFSSYGLAQSLGIGDKFGDMAKDAKRTAEATEETAALLRDNKGPVYVA